MAVSKNAFILVAILFCFGCPKETAESPVDEAMSDTLTVNKDDVDGTIQDTTDALVEPIVVSDIEAASFVDETLALILFNGSAAFPELGLNIGGEKISFVNENTSLKNGKAYPVTFKGKSYVF